MKEKERHTASGFAYLVLMILIVPFAIWGIIYFSQPEQLQPFAKAGCIIVLILDLLSFK